MPLIAEFVGTITAFVAAHMYWIGVAIFLATTLESMAIVGSIFPGMSIVIALAGIAASLGANIWVLVAWCAAGAVLGDGASYWLGHRYGDRLRGVWPFSGNPQLLDRGVGFFHRYGGMSIVVGRFLPFTRAVVPLAAGMLGMNPARFFVANVLSAIGWALLSILPAAGLGLAFTVINAASSRVAVMLGVIVAVFLSAWIFAQVTARLLLPWFDILWAKAYRALEGRSDRATRFLGDLFGSTRRPTTASVAWLIVTMGLAAAFAGVLEDVVTGDPLVRADIAINHIFQIFRTPLGDGIMVAITLMGDSVVVMAASAVLLAGLAILRAWRTFGLAFVALAGTALFVPLLKLILHKPRPIEIYSGASAFGFPSGHSAFAGVLLGLVAVIGTRGLSRNAQAAVWTMAFTVSIMIGLSRIYLSAHWPSDVIGGLLFGWTMAGLFGLFEERLGDRAVRPVLIGLATTASLFLAWGVHATASFSDSLVRYTPRESVADVTQKDWTDTGWKGLPAARIDLKGEFEEPLILQVAATPDRIGKALAAAGWSRPPAMGWRDAAQFVGRERSLAALLPLPLLHNGSTPVLTMIAPEVGAGPRRRIVRRTVVRLWRSDARIADAPGRPFIYLASLTEEWVLHPLAGINVLRDAPASPQQVARLVAVLAGNPALRVRPALTVQTPKGPWLVMPRNGS